MYKSKFKFIGQTGFILILGLVFISVPIGLLINFIKTGLDKKVLIFVGPPVLLGLSFVWHKILTEMNELEITESTIQIKNLFTKRTKKIDKKKLKGFKDTFNNGYTILIIDRSDKTIARIHDYYYKDFKELIDNLGLDYIERVPTFWEKIIKIELKE